MDLNWLSAILPHHPIFSDRSITGHKLADSLHTPLFQESRIAVRKEELIVASPFTEKCVDGYRPELRWLNLADLKSAALNAIKSRTSQKQGDGELELDVDSFDEFSDEDILAVCLAAPYKRFQNGNLDFPARKISLHKNGTDLLVFGYRKVCVIKLPASNILRYSSLQDIDCDATQVGSYYYGTDEFNHIVDAQWHPMPSIKPIVTVLSTSTELRVFNLAISYTDPVLVETFLESDSTSYSSTDEQPVALAWGTLNSGGLWDFATAYLLTSNSSLYGKCPIIVPGTHIPEKTLLKLYLTVNDRSLDQCGQKMLFVKELYKSVKSLDQSLSSDGTNWLIFGTPIEALSLYLPKTQGPLLAENSGIVAKGIQSVGLCIPDKVNWPLCFVSYENGLIYMHFRCGGLLPVWDLVAEEYVSEDDGSSTLTRKFPLYQTIDLCLTGSKLQAGETGPADGSFTDDVLVLANYLVQDSSAPSKIFAFHDFGAHVLCFKDVLELFDARVENSVTCESLLSQSVTEATKLDFSPIIKVSELLTTVLVSIDKRTKTMLSNAIVGMSFFCDSSSAKAGIFLANSGHVLVLNCDKAVAADRDEIAVQGKALQEAGLEKSHSQLTGNAAFGLVSKTFRMPEWLANWSAPRLMTASTVSLANLKELTPEVLLKLTERVREIGTVGLHVEELCDGLKDRTMIHERILDDISQQTRVLVKQWDSEVSVKQGSLEERVKALKSQQAVLNCRTNAFLQIIVDGYREIELSELEIEWMSNLKGHAVRVKRYSQEVQTLKSKLRAIINSSKKVTVAQETSRKDLSPPSEIEPGCTNEKRCEGEALKEIHHQDRDAKDGRLKEFLSIQDGLLEETKATLEQLQITVNGFNSEIYS